MNAGAITSEHAKVISYLNKTWPTSPGSSRRLGILGLWSTGIHEAIDMEKSVFAEERAQGSVETLLVLGLAVTAAVTVGYFLKNFVTKEVQPKVSEKT